MALYLGTSGPLKFVFKDGIFSATIPSHLPSVNGIMLLSLDNYILKDSNGVYLTVKESE